MKNKKAKVLLTSIMTIALCLCLMVGSTFAMFTAESSVNVMVSSAKVSVIAKADSVSVDKSGTSFPMAQATFDENQVLNIVNMVPGDIVKFNITVTNESTIAVKYNAVLKATGDNAELFSYLTFKIGGETYKGETLDKGWQLLDPDTKDLGTIPVEIYLPETVGNLAQGLTCSIAYTVQAIQSNVEDADIPNYFPAT